MPAESERFDVRLLAVPPKTPAGEDFTRALARVFMIEPWMAEHFVREAPVVVKRAQDRDVAERLRQTLTRLGADVEILGAAHAATIARHMPSLPLGTRRPTLPPGFQVSSWSEAAPMEPSRSSVIISSPAIPLSSLPAASLPASSLRPTVTPTIRTTVPQPRAEGGSFLSTAALVLVAAAAGALSFAGITHWMHVRGLPDERMLGNASPQETTCQTHYGLTGPGLPAERRTTLTIVVAWNGGCLVDDYARFLERVADTHRGEVTVVAAALTTPTAGASAPPSYESWPPRQCPTTLEILPVDRGYVSDYLSTPATYLYDADGSLIAAWSGAMSAEQRARLTSWLDGQPGD